MISSSLCHWKQWKEHKSKAPFCRISHFISGSEEGGFLNFSYACIFILEETLRFFSLLFPFVHMPIVCSLFHTPSMSFTFNFLRENNLFSNSPFLRFGSRIAGQNGDARKSSARKDVRWITWVEETAAPTTTTTTPEMETPEAMEVRMLATQTQSALQCQRHREYLWTRASTQCTRQFRNQSQRWLKITGKFVASATPRESNV